MNLTDIFIAQLTDPLRIALAIGLVVTMLRTQADTGTWMPLAAGVAFIAAIIPLTAGSTGPAFLTVFGVGLASSAVLVGVVLGLATLVLRGRGR